MLVLGGEEWSGNKIMKTFTYTIRTIRRRSKNNGINFCQYWVVVNVNTGEIVYDENWNISKVENKQRAQSVCDRLNNGELETKTWTRSDGTIGEYIKFV